MNNTPVIPRVSVIIPSYNCARYIGEALESLRSQTCKDYEAVIVDDGSNDGTEAAVAPYLKDPRIRYIRQENAGPGPARNTGVREARAELVAFLDADDVLTPQSLELRLAVLDQEPAVAFVFSDTYVRKRAEQKQDEEIFFTGRRFLEKFAPAIERVDGDIRFFNLSLTRYCLKENLFPWTGTVMLRKSCFNACGYFSSELRGSEDKLMWLQLLKRYKAAYVNRPLAVYNKFRSGLTLDYERYCVDSIANLKLFLEHEFSAYPQESRVTRDKIADHYFELAYHYLHKGLPARARRYFLLSMKYNPRDGKNYAYLPAACLPAGLFRALTGMKRKAGR